MRRIALMLAIASTGCPPRPAPAPIPILSDLPACGPELVPPAPADVCSGLFTAAGLACVHCKGAGGCLDQVDAVYCTRGACESDPTCHIEIEEPLPAAVHR